jgi:hypothetical protein
MADSGGHWLNLAQLQLLTQSELLPGVIDESPKRGGLLTEFPVKQAMGLDIKWNRSNARRSATRIAVGTKITWSDNVTYSQVTSALKIFVDQTPLNNFVRDVYGSINNYEAQQLLELRTGVVETLEDALIYDDVDYNDLHITGLHHWAVDNTGTDGDIDEQEGALSFANMRVQRDFMKHGIDWYHMSFVLARQIDTFYQEGAIGDSSTAGIGRFMWMPSETGMPMPFWGAVPVRRSDFMLAEQANTGVGSDARAKQTSGVNQYSIFAILRGSGMTERDPGMNIAFGGDTHQNGEFFRPQRFEQLEDYDASGLRLTSYNTLTCGSTLGVGRIADITDAIPTA